MSGVSGIVSRNVPSGDGRELKELNYPNGDKYVGECQGHKRDGRGIYYYKDGSRYEGMTKKAYEEVKECRTVC